MADADVARCRVSAFGASLGARRPVAGLDEPQEILDVLAAGGFETFRAAEASPPELAREAIRQTLEASRIRVGDIATVVWATTSFQKRSWYTDDVSMVLADLGLGKTDVIGVTLAECGNFGPALRTAMGSVADAEAPAILVCTDAAAPGRSRVVAPAVAVLSDGAVSCLVAADAGRLLVEAVRQASNHAMRRLDARTEGMRVLRTTAVGVALAAQRALTSAKIGPGDVDLLLLPSYSRSAQALLALQCGVDVSRVRTPSMADCGHLFAGDVLAALPALAQELTPGSVALAIGAGTCVWSAAVLRAT